jgi:hypothetical protein
MMILYLFLNLCFYLINADQSIIETDFHNNLPAEFNNPEFLNFWKTNIRTTITNINNNDYIGINNNVLLILNDLYCSGSNSSRTSCIELRSSLVNYNNDYDILMQYKLNRNQVSIKALPLIPFVLLFYVAPVAIQIIGEITLKLLEQRMEERRNIELRNSDRMRINYNNNVIRSILRNFCITGNGMNNRINMNDCNNNINQRFTAELVNEPRLIYVLRQGNNACVDVEFQRRSNGANIILFPCNKNSPNQQWIKDINNRFHPIHALDKCLDISNSRTNNGAEIILFDCNIHAANQKWI